MDIFACKKEGETAISIFSGEDVQIFWGDHLEEILKGIVPIFYSTAPDYTKTVMTLEPFEFLCFCAALDILRKNILISYLEGEVEESISYEPINAGSLIQRIKKDAEGTFCSKVKRNFNSFFINQ